MTNHIALEIEKLLSYGLEKGLLNKWDLVPTRNAIMDLLQLSEPYPQKLDYKVEDSPQSILNKLVDYAAKEGLLEADTITYRDLFDTKIMGLLMPRQSEVVSNFWTRAEDNIKDATDYFYALSQDSNYIRKDRIAKNMHWLAETNYGDLEITINLSKPEKDPKAIAAAKKMQQSSYPKCFLCFENVGYPGRVNHPARQNHRVIPINLNNQQWFLQYSPYVYYNEHSIVFSAKHEPMCIDRDTFINLLDFVEQIPHYFLGSNADLPLVGGSILSHDHFQGGHHSFPMEKAEIETKYLHPNFSEVEAGIVNWPMSVIRLQSKDKKQIIELADLILSNWREYSDLSREIQAFSKKNGEKIPHNTITPIARNQKGIFELDLVLRNNRTSLDYPAGIFHPHQELHHIKKENIGLIEVMGLAVLPGRLKYELGQLEEYLTGEEIYNQKSILDTDIAKHAKWIEELLLKYGSKLSKEEAKKVLQKEIGIKFAKVLEHAGVFKQDQKGKEGFDQFLTMVGFKKNN
ncbi:galactose-1-phosphate uridylyltransferase [Orenia metallireducens]|uniref:Galactose-1-phosphate uridylyltransferase n=1 Tax=Orenia metallireducens TaxID=1413210 RepID=A0A1C0ADH8_9FIRM|nr:UDP-glucose--hexose-1-phosphate uridylyltransferase [Orenia metallireducens]OCL28746.1 galactose-1-phosphate uridylyltransferase [Orenia metallireducens]